MPSSDYLEIVFILYDTHSKYQDRECQRIASAHHARSTLVEANVCERMATFDCCDTQCCLNRAKSVGGSHRCVYCKQTIHAICGQHTPEAVREMFAPSAAAEGSGSVRICTACFQASSGYEEASQRQVMTHTRRPDNASRFGSRSSKPIELDVDISTAIENGSSSYGPSHVSVPILPKNDVIHGDRQMPYHQMKPRCISADTNSPVHEENATDDRRDINDKIAVCLSRLERWRPGRRTASFWGLYKPIQEADGTIMADVAVCALCPVKSSTSAATLCKQTKGDKRARKGIIKCGKKHGAKSAWRHVEKSHSRLLSMIEQAASKVKTAPEIWKRIAGRSCKFPFQPC